MTPYYQDEQVTLWHGDALDVLTSFEPASVDAVVTDPPYGLEFMGREWDGSDGFRRSLNPADADRDSVVGRTSRKAPEYRTSGAGQRGKPGIGARETEWVSNQGWNGFRCRGCGCLAHGGSPCQCEAPDFARADNRWPLYQEWCGRWARECLRVLKPGGHLLAFGGTRTYHRLACAIEDAGFEVRDSITWLYGSGFPKSRNLGGDWQGWGTALKPASEPIVVARKPLSGTVAANVQAHGTGALNIAGCRVGASERINPAGGSSSLQRVSRVQQGYRDHITTSEGDASSVVGRWPTNVVLDGTAAVELDRQSGEHPAGSRVRGTEPSDPCDVIYGERSRVPFQGHQDSGGASRFFPVFRYEAKADAAERPRVDGVAHPTVKPVALMRWLVRLVTPPGGLVLDPFAGSGTTAEACAVEGFRCVAVEREADYLPLVRARLSKPLQGVLPLEVGS